VLVLISVLVIGMVLVLVREQVLVLTLALVSVLEQGLMPVLVPVRAPALVEYCISIIGITGTGMSTCASTGRCQENIGFPLNRKCRL